MEKRERDIEKWLQERVRAIGGLAFKFVSPGNDGVPDRIIVLPGGRVWFIELKREGERPTALQEWQIERLRALGCNAEALVGMQEVIDWFWEAVR